MFYLANTQKLKKCIDLSVMLKNTHYIIHYYYYYYCEKQSASLKKCLIFKPQNILRICILMFIDG